MQYRGSTGAGLAQGKNRACECNTKAHGWAGLAQGGSKEGQRDVEALQSEFCVFLVGKMNSE